MKEFLEYPAVWGFFGAMIYGLPRFSACYWQCKDSKTGWARCLFDFVICLAIGSISSFALAPWAQEFFKRPGALELRAISVAIGLLSNRLAPKMVEVSESLLTKKLTGSGS